MWIFLDLFSNAFNPDFFGHNFEKLPKIQWFIFRQEMMPVGRICYFNMIFFQKKIFKNIKKFIKIIILLKKCLLNLIRNKFANKIYHFI